MKKITTLCFTILALIAATTGQAQLAGLNAQATTVQVDPSSGSANVPIRIPTPPGRGGIEPNLTLGYSSGSRGLGLAGVGWGMDLGAIVRSSKKGLPKYDSTDMFILSSGATLVDIGGGQYRQEIEGVFAKIEKRATDWVITDKKGVKYYYGTTTDSRNVDPANSSKIFRWALCKVEDLNGNYMTISYTQDGNQIYPLSIVYTGYQGATTGLVTGPNAEVRFNYQAAAQPQMSYGPGFLMTTAKVLSNIKTYAGGTSTAGGVLQSTYTFTYIASPDSGRDLLSSITQLGSDSVSKTPSVTFTYTQNSRNFVAATGWNIPPVSFLDIDGNVVDRGVRLVDLNSDGYTDIIQNQKTCTTDTYTYYSGSDQFVPCGDNGNTKGMDVYINNKANGWSLASSWSNQTAPVFLNQTKGLMSANTGTYAPTVSFYKQDIKEDKGVRFVDVDGNGYTDLVQLFSSQGFVTPADISNWGLVQGKGYITPSGFIRAVPPDTNPGIPADLVTLLKTRSAGQTISNVFLNSGTQLSTASSSTIPSGLIFSVQTRTAPIVEYYNGGRSPAYAIAETGTTKPLDMAFADVNGDGYVDIVTTGDAAHVYLNVKGTNSTGLGWQEQSPTTFPNLGNIGQDPIMVDLNGDGLTDIFYVTDAEAYVYMNTGGTFVKDNNSPWTKNIDIPSCNLRAFGTVFDINGDGMSDLVCAAQDGSFLKVYANTGNGWMLTTNWQMPVFNTIKTALMDANGDGLMDYVQYNASVQPWINTSAAPADLLSTVNNGLGVVTTITYDAATHFANTFLPSPFPVVKAVATSAGSRTYTTTYKYAGGLFDSVYREFAGFKTVTVTDPDGNYTVTNFDQRHFYKGRAIDSATYAASNKLYTKTVNQYAETTLISQPDMGVSGPNTSKFIYLSRTDNYTYEGQATPKRTAQTMAYDSYGNVTTTVNLGEVDQATGADVGTDKTTVQVDYLNNTAAYLLGFPYHTQSMDYAGAVTGQTWFYYDGATAYTTSPTVGRLTRKDEYLNATTSLTTTYAYNAVGNLLSTTDPLNKTTAITYDSLFNIFPVQTTNALSQSVKTYYYGINSSSLSTDPMYNAGLAGLWGQTMAVVDANNQKVFKSYDALGRQVKAYGPLDSFTYPTSTITYTTYSNYVQVYTQNRITSGQAATLDTSSFYDGLGRLIESKRPSATAGQYVASDQKTYNARGLVEKAFLPVFVSTNLNTLDSIPPDTQPKAMIYYDALGRKNKTVNPDGTYANATFGVWQLSAFDENGHRIDSTYDAYGRLATKQEFTGSDGRHTAYPAVTFAPYATTTYQYDSKGNLNKVIDAKGNTTNITYDALGRKTGMTDPDMHGWSYTYDANGNLKSQTDANTKTMSFSYDALNRLTNKTDGTTTFGTFGYDGTANGYAIGRMTGVTSSAVGTSNLYSYDALGREVTDDMWVGSYHYSPTTRVYDALNRLAKVNYPDGTNTMGYVYDAAGQATGVNKLNTDGTINTKFIQNITYNANGQMLTVLYGNNVTTTYTYDPVNYRLKSIVTQLAGAATKLQDLAYTYDGVGNILTITDNVNTATQTFKYDELNRLISAATPAGKGYGTKTYAYDQIGNITQKDGLTYTYGANGAGPHAVTATSDGTSYRYDSNGNMIQKTTVRGQWTYVYDTENRLISVGYAPNGKAYKTISNYTYDGKGVRFQKVVYRYSDTDYNNSDTWSILVTQIGAPTIPAGGSITSTTTYAGNYYEAEDNRFTKRVFLGSTLVASMTQGQVSYYHNDHLGSVNVISDSAGASRSLTEYDPFGKISRFERYGTNIKVGWEGFNNKRLDDETGLLFYGGRYYDPKLGRFMTADIFVPRPNHPQELNRYSYVLNNPINRVDPSGHKSFWKKFSGFFGAVIGTVVGVMTGNPFLGIAVYSAIAASGQGGNFAANFGLNAVQALGVVTGNPFFIASSVLAVASSATAQLGGSTAGGIARGLGYASLAFAAAGVAQQIGHVISQANAARAAAQNAKLAATLGLSTDPLPSMVGVGSDTLQDGMWAIRSAQEAQYAAMAAVDSIGVSDATWDIASWFIGGPEVKATGIIAETTGRSIAGGGLYNLSRSAGGFARIRDGMSVNQINRLIATGKAPLTVSRADIGSSSIIGELDHLHFTDKTALYADGMFKHGGRELTNAEADFIKRVGWKLPQE